MLYDLNSYINNVRVILHACNNYLKVSPPSVALTTLPS